MAVTVQETVALCGLSEASVIAGSAGLARQVDAVNIMEAPDIWDWLRGNDLVLTALYSMREDVTAQCHLVSALNASGASALMVKTKRWVDHLNDQVLREADSLDFPIIEIPVELHFEEVVRLVLGQIFASHAPEFQRSENVRRRFNAIPLNQEGVDLLARELAALVHNPVIVRSPQSGLLATTWPAIRTVETRSPVEASSCIDRALRCRRSPAVYRLAGEKCEHEGSAVHVPISHLGRPVGELIVLETEHRLGERDLLAVEQAATAVSLDLVKQMAASEVEYRFRDEFADDLLTGRIRESVSVYSRSAVIGWNLRRPLHVVVIHRDERRSQNEADDGQDRAERRRILNLVVETLRTGGQDEIAAAERLGDIILLAPTASASLLPGLGTSIRRKVVAELPGSVISIGIGEPASDHTELPRSYREACDAIHFGRLRTGANRTNWYREMGLFRVLAAVPDHDLLSSAVPDGLRLLSEYDHDHGTELQRTLRAYLESNGNMRLTAERLFIHYKTLCYRLGRIRHISGVDLDSSTARLDLSVGLYILDLQEHRLTSNPGALSARGQSGAGGR